MRKNMSYLYSEGVVNCIESFSRHGIEWVYDVLISAFVEGYGSFSDYDWGYFDTALYISTQKRDNLPNFLKIPVYDLKGIAEYRTEYIN